jgi:hypothetical protein
MLVVKVDLRLKRSMSASGTKPPIRIVGFSTAIGGKPDMGRPAQFSRDRPIADIDLDIFQAVERPFFLVAKQFAGGLVDEMQT